MSLDRSSPVRRQTAAVFALTVALLLTGCSAISDDPEPPEPDEAVEGFSSVGVYNITVITESTVDNRTTELRVERTVRPATGERYQVTHRDGDRIILVSNGTTRWQYRPAANRVQRLPDSGFQESEHTEQLRELFDSLGSDGDSNDPFVPLSPLFAPNAGNDSGSDNNTGFGPEPMETQYQGIETVGGRDAHVITVETTAAAEVEIQQTVYYDTEFFVRLQSEYNMTVEGDRVTGETRAQRVDFSPSVDESIFEFEPPADATVVDTDIEQYDTYVGLSLGTDSHVPDPDLPAEFEFETATVRDGNLTMSYSSGLKTVFITRLLAATELPDESETIDYRGRTYQYNDELRGALIRWECGDNVYTVSGDLKRDTILDVGASIACPAPADG